MMDNQTRMDVKTPRPSKSGKDYFVKIGSAWPTKSGGWSITLDALPTPVINDKGVLETRLLLMAPFDDVAPARSSPVRAGGSDGPDDFPF